MNLTKTQFMDGRACCKKLWLSIHRPEVCAKWSIADLKLFEDGKRFGQYARDRYAGGQFVAGQDTVAETARLIEKGVEILYEATFEADGMLVKVDVLKHLGDSWEIVEAKGSSSAKKEHYADIAFQVFVVRANGLDVRKATIVHYDKSYRLKGTLNFDRLLKETDVTEEADALQEEIAVNGVAFHALFDLSDEPTREGCWPHMDPGLNASCGGCGFVDHCAQYRSAHDIYHYFSRSGRKLKEWREQRLDDISQLPTNVKMTDVQQRAVDVAMSGSPWVSDELADALGGLKYPVHCIDFETAMYAEPKFEGTTVHQQICSQWSDHVLHAPPVESDGKLEFQSVEHREFIHTAASDPREPFCRSLLQAVEGEGTILHYSGFERTQLKDMDRDEVAGADQLLGVVSDRLQDLQKILKSNYVHPNFKGKSSIKAVLPVVAPEFSYKSLEIQGGGDAQVLYMKAFDPSVNPDEAEKIFADLLAYCRMDTWGMVQVLLALYNAA